jgi:small ubiquitin-related modifier
MSEQPKAESQINLKVVDSENTETFFKIRRTMALRKLIDAYCQRYGCSRDAVRFLFDGQRVNAEDTPEKLGMEDMAQIDVAVEQSGGC